MKKPMRLAKVQLNKQQAIAFYDSGIWKSWSSQQLVDFQLFQDRVCLPFDVFAEAVNEVVGRPVFTHEYGNAYALQTEYLRNNPTPEIDSLPGLVTFLEISETP